MSIEKIAFGSGLFLLALFGGWVIWLVTPYGVGIYYDSLEYVSAARNLATGLGLARLTCNSIELLTHYPPLYSIVLSGFELLGSDSLSGARLIDIVCMAGTVAMTGLITLRICENRFFALLAALVVAISSIVINYYSWAMSESLYMVTMLIGMFLFGHYLTDDSSLVLISTAILASITVLTRFIGIALIASYVLFLIIHLKNKYRILDGRFLKPLALFCTISLLPLGLWLLRNRILSGTATNRAAGWYLSSPSRIIPLAYIAKWFIPWSGGLSWNWKAFVIFMIMSSAFVLLSAGLIKNSKNSDLPWIIITNIVIYLGLVLVLMAIADPLTPLDNRILLPVYVLTVILVVSGISYLWRRPNNIYKAVAIASVVYFIAFQSYKSVPLISNLREDGQFYSSSAWRNSEVSKTLMELSPQTIYTNDMIAVYFDAQKPSCNIPMENKPHDLENFRAAIAQEPSMAIAIYNRSMSGFVSPELFKEGLKVIKLSDGEIYTH